MPSDPGETGQPLVGIVGPQGQPVLGAGGEHAVGLGHAARHEVVDEHADIGLGAIEHDGGSPPPPTRGVDARHQTLGRGLLIAGRAVDLAGEIEPGDALDFEVRAGARADRHSRTRWRSPAAASTARSSPGIGRDERRLHVLGQRGRDPVRIDRVVVKSFWLKENLVAVAARRSGRPCPRSRGNSAGRCLRSGRNRSAPGAGWRG